MAVALTSSRCYKLVVEVAPGVFAGKADWFDGEKFRRLFRMRFYSRISGGAAIAFLAFLAASCATHKDVQHRVVISVKDQRLALLDRETLVAVYSVSTSKYGPGDCPASRCTPLGELEIAKKIGDNAPPGAVFKDRRRTGEIVLPDAPGRDPIVTRVIWLRGRESQNANAFRRYIYIHGTPEERNLGLPVSYGCVRMSSNDVIKLYDVVGTGARVTISDAPLAAVVPVVGSETQIVSTGNGGIIAR
jgi:hypothetical protein